MSSVTTIRKAPSPGHPKSTYASVVKKTSQKADGSHFRPLPMQPPWKGCTPEEYTNYVASYKIYVAALNESRAEFWASASAAARGEARTQPRVDTQHLKDPYVFHVQIPSNEALNETLKSRQDVLQFRNELTRGGVAAKDLTVKRVVQSVPIIQFPIAKSPSPPPPYVPSPLEVEARKERQRSARRRQRAARSLRDQAAALKAAVLKDNVKKAELEAAKSTKRLADWTVVQHHKIKSKLPVPKLKTGANASVAPVARPAWYPITKEQAVALAKQWGPAK